MLWLFSAAAVGYLALVWLAPLTTRQAQPVVRIQAPAMPMLVFGAILAIEALQSDRPNARWRWSAAMIVVVGGLGIALARSCRSWALELGSAPDPASASRARNVAAAVAELQNLTRSLPQDCNLVSNAPALVWYLTRRPATAFGEDPRFVLQRDRGKRREIAVVARGGIEGLDYFIYSKAPHKFAMPVVRTRALLFAGSYWGVWETGIADQGRVGGDIRRHLANSYPMSSVVGVAGVPARKLE